MSEHKLPSGALICTHRNGKIVGLDTIYLEDYSAYLTAEVRDALSRLSYASNVRRYPRAPYQSWSHAGPKSSWIEVETPTKRDYQEAFEVLTAADAGDPAPALAMAERYVSEWPANCKWRFDHNHWLTVVTPTDEFLEPGEIRQRVLDATPLAPRKGWLVRHVEGSLRDGARVGLYECSRTIPARFRRIGPVLPEDILAVGDLEGRIKAVAA